MKTFYSVTSSGPFEEIPVSCAVVYAGRLVYVAAHSPKRGTVSYTGCACPGCPSFPPRTQPSFLSPKRGQDHPLTVIRRNAGCSGGLCHTHSF